MPAVSRPWGHELRHHQETGGDAVASRATEAEAGVTQEHKPAGGSRQKRMPNRGCDRNAADLVGGQGIGCSRGLQPAQSPQRANQSAYIGLNRFAVGVVKFLLKVTAP